MYLKNKAFTLIEILIWILIFSIVIIWGFKAFSSVTIWKIRLIQKTNIEKESIYFTQKLFEMIKLWWTIDYEEYFNRKVVWTAYASWHYLKETWFWNFGPNWSVWTITFWNNFYYCVSWSWTTNKMWTNWCYNSNYNTLWANTLLKPQRYWEYSFQFIDYNSNYNGDKWDENWDWNIVWDDDDEYLWKWPSVFTWGVDVKEIYLISWDHKTRTVLRWKVKKDPDIPTGSTINCNFWNGSSPTWSWCLWTIEFLKLDWKDWGFDHDPLTTWTWLYDWVIDTWLINDDFTWKSNIIAWSWASYEQYWQRLFPKKMNIENFKVEAYPNKDINLAWKENINISPYLRISFSIAPAWRERLKMKWHFPTLNFSTTVNLTDIYSK